MTMQTQEPRGELTVRTIAMPADTNANGDMFGGWVLSQMDLAGGIAGVDRSHGRVVTVALDARLDLSGRTIRNRVTILTRAPEEAAATFSFSLAFTGTLAIGSRVDIRVTGGPADVEVLWRASYNPVFAVGVVRFDSEGNGVVSFVVPRAAVGRTILLEFVDWTGPQVVGIAAWEDGRIRPGSVNSGLGAAPLVRLRLIPLLLTLLAAVGSAGTSQAGRRRRRVGSDARTPRVRLGSAPNA
jgi:hypothetical protein